MRICSRFCGRCAGVNWAYKHLHLEDCLWDESVMFAHAVVDLCADIRCQISSAGVGERTTNEQAIKCPRKCLKNTYLSKDRPEREQLLSKTTYQCH